MKTYQQHKVGLYSIYTKGVVMDDSIRIRPIISTASRTSFCIFNNTPAGVTAMKNNAAAPARSTAYNEPLNQTELLIMFSNALVGSNHS